MSSCMSKYWLNGCCTQNAKTNDTRLHKDDAPGLLWDILHRLQFIELPTTWHTVSRQISHLHMWLLHPPLSPSPHATSLSLSQWLFQHSKILRYSCMLKANFILTSLRGLYHIFIFRNPQQPSPTNLNVSHEIVDFHFQIHFLVGEIGRKNVIKGVSYLPLETLLELLKVHAQVTRTGNKMFLFDFFLKWNAKFWAENYGYFIKYKSTSFCWENWKT